MARFEPLPVAERNAAKRRGHDKHLQAFNRCSCETLQAPLPRLARHAESCIDDLGTQVLTRAHGAPGSKTVCCLCSRPPNEAFVGFLRHSYPLHDLAATQPPKPVKVRCQLH